MTIQERIKLALSRSGKSQTDLAKRLDKHTGTVSEMLSKELDIDSIAYVRATAELTGFSFEWLRTGEGSEQESELTIVQESSTKYLEGKDVRPVTVTVNPSGEELVSYVPVKDTFASLMDQAGANHTGLMKYMGLRKRETLEKYVKTNSKVIAADIGKMNELIKNKTI